MSFHERYFNFPLFHGHSTSDASVQAGSLNLKERCRRILSHADIKIDGSRPWDMKIRDDRFYARVLSEGSMGLGESYMDGWWDVEALDEFFFRIFRTKLDEQSLTWRDGLSALKARIINQQKISRAFQIGRHHYDLTRAHVGNDLAALVGERVF